MEKTSDSYFHTSDDGNWLYANFRIEHNNFAFGKKFWIARVLYFPLHRWLLNLHKYPSTYISNFNKMAFSHAGIKCIFTMLLLCKYFIINIFQALSYKSHHGRCKERHNIWVQPSMGFTCNKVIFENTIKRIPTLQKWMNGNDETEIIYCCVLHLNVYIFWCSLNMVNFSL